MSITASDESAILGDASLGVELDVEVLSSARVCVIQLVSRFLREEELHELTPAGNDRVQRSEAVGIGLPDAAQEGLVVVNGGVELRSSRNRVGTS